MSNVTPRRTFVNAPQPVTVLGIVARDMVSTAQPPVATHRQAVAPGKRQLACHGCRMGESCGRATLFGAWRHEARWRIHQILRPMTQTGKRNREQLTAKNARAVDNTIDCRQLVGIFKKSWIRQPGRWGCSRQVSGSAAAGRCLIIPDIVWNYQTQISSKAPRKGAPHAVGRLRVSRKTPRCIAGSDTSFQPP